MTYAKGEYVFVIDGDLQDPPEVIPQLYSRSCEGYDVVYGIRKKRKEYVFKRFLYWSFYRILRSVSETKIDLDSGDFCIMRTSVLDIILSIPEKHLFIRGLRSWTGFRQTGVDYERAERFIGSPKYTFLALLRLAMNGIYGFSNLPVRLFGHLRIFAVFVSIICSILVLAEKYFHGRFPDKITMLFIAMIFISNVHLVSLRRCWRICSAHI